MTHMLAFGLFTGLPGVTDGFFAGRISGSGSSAVQLPFDPNDICPQFDFNRCMADMNVR